MIWNVTAFEQGCISLTKALESINSLDLQWTLEEANVNGHCVIYLFQRRTACFAETMSAPQIVDRHDNHDIEVDDEIYVDPDTAVVVETAERSGALAMDWQWHLSVVYNETWQSPVLYFHVQDERGEPCPRSRIVKLLSNLHHQNQVSDSWDFVSQEEHPVTRVPSFFLHPCRSNERLGHLTATEGSHNAAISLLQWMSITLPAIGLALSSSDFVKLSTILRDTEYSKKAW